MTTKTVDQLESELGDAIAVTSCLTTAFLELETIVDKGDAELQGIIQTLKGRQAAAMSHRDSLRAQLKQVKA